MNLLLKAFKFMTLECFILIVGFILALVSDYQLFLLLEESHTFLMLLFADILVSILLSLANGFKAHTLDKHNKICNSLVWFEASTLLFGFALLFLFVKYGIN